MKLRLCKNQYHDEVLILELIACIKAIRNSKNITLEVFYFDTGIHLARLEKGKANITVSTLSKICNYFDMTLLDFFQYLENYTKNNEVNT